MSRSIYFSASFIIVCLCGFSYQVIQVSLDYFAFKTTTKVKLQLESEYRSPMVIFCTRYTDIINRTNHEKYGINPNPSSSFRKYMSDMSKLTVNDIFDLTPKPQEAMIGCVFRNNVYTTNILNQTDCYSRILVLKYQEGQYICYVFKSQETSKSLNCNDVSRSVVNENELFVVTLSRTFLLANSIQMISALSALNTVPSISRRFYDKRIRFGRLSPETSVINYIKISGDVYKIERLEPPYDTMCTGINEEIDHICRRKCNIEVFKKHNLWPANEYTTEPIGLRHLTVITASNSSLINDVTESYTNCAKHCTKKHCRTDYSVSVAVDVNVKSMESLSISSSCSRRPVVFVQYLPRIVFMEFALYVSSCLGIWFGVSVISLNPFKSKKNVAIHRNTKIISTRQSFVEQLRNKTKNCAITKRFGDIDKRMSQMESLLLSWHSLH